MGEVVIRVPKNRKNIKIIRSSELIEREIQKRQFFLNSLIELKNKQNQVIEEVSTEPEIEQIEVIQFPNRTHFTEKFTISESNQPTSIEFFAPTEPEIDWDILQNQIQESYNKGFREGESTARAIDEKEFEKLKSINRRIDVLAEKFRFEYSNQLDELKKYLVELSLTVAEQIVGYEIDTNKNFFLSHSQKLLKEVDKNLIYKIFINQDDVELFRSSKSELTSDPSIFDDIKWIVDDNVEKGFIKLETSIGEFDRTLRTQLEILRENLKEELQSSDINEEIGVIEQTYRKQMEVEDANT